MMQVQINFGDVPGSPALTDAVHKALDHTLRLFADRLTRVEVHLRDDNGPKSGVDKRCLIEARLAGLEPLAVESRAADLYQAIHDACGKLERAIRNRIERHDARLTRHNP
jgi:ribosome-associated translation inhibitor RaiA